GGGGGQAQAQTQTHKYAIVLNAQKLPEVKWGSSYTSLGHKDKDLQFTHTSNFGIKKNIILSFNNTDEVVAEKKDAVVFGAATYLPPYGKVSGFDDKRLTERKNAVDWIGTTKPGLVGYSYEDVTCNSSNCPEVSYKTQFTFDKHQLAKKKTDNKLDIYEDKSRDNSPIYKLPDYPGLGVSFNLSGESTVKPKRLSQLVSSFSEDVTQQNGANSPYKDKNLVYTTDDYRNQGNHNHQDKHHAIIFYLNAKLHLLDKKQIKNIAQGKTFNLGTLKPRIDLTEAWKNRNGGFFNNGNWTFEDKGEVSVKLSLPEVKAGRCTNAAHPNPNAQAPSPALTAPALWFGPVQNGKVQMYSASVSTYPDSSSSRIFLQNLKRKTDTSRPGRYSLADLSASDIQSKEPTFTSRQTIIRLDGGVQQIKLDRSNAEVTGFNGNTNNDTFGIVKEYSFTPKDDEWKKVLLPWTVRASANDNKFQQINQQSDQYSQRYRSRDNGKRERNLGDIVNSPIVAVGEYLATSANDGMVHIFKKGNGGDDRNYSLKLSYIPGTMPRQYFDNDTSALKDSTLAKELRTFAEKGYVGDRYGVDGGFVLRQVERNGKDHVFMFGAMGFGGRGAYALDLTKADGNDPTKASLFDVKNNGNNGNNGNNSVKLGYTVGTPQIGKTHDGKYAAFLASGYATKQIDSGENTTALYVYDLESSGNLITKIDVPGGKGGLSSPTLVDKDLDGTVDIAYAGDRGGNMYRFDLSGNNPNSWTVRTIFEGNKPITSAPAISQLKDKRVVIFGTGSDLSEDDVDSKEIQHVYGIFDNDTDTGVAKDGQGNGLLEQVLKQEDKTLFLTDYKRSDGSGSKGWVVKLKDGQRVTVKPTVVLRTAFVTIRKYNDGGCGAETAILGINTADGGKLTKKSARPIVPDTNTAVAQYSGHKKTSSGKSIPIGCMEKDNGIACPNGYVYDKPVNVRYLDEKKTDGFSTTADGDAGGSGTFKEGKKPARNNRCFSGKGVRTLLMNDLDSLDITGPTCGMKRISWREVFF
ncbi:PilC family type IV pilus tip adhesin, partial [Neisseria meningitidis]|uniref:PilC family type IV pilus tip adhesin n=2 Tax=Neisseria meningitidis TaxID=487 RepID=UPI001F0CCBD7